MVDIFHTKTVRVPWVFFFFRMGGNQTLSPGSVSAVTLRVELQIIKHREQRRQRQRGRGEMSQRRCRRLNSGSGVDVRVLLEKCKKNVFILILLSTHTHTHKHEKPSACWSGCTFGGQMSFIGSENVSIISFPPSGWNWREDKFNFENQD